MWSWQRVDCPICKQPRGQKCRTLATGRITDTHIPRIDRAHYAAARAQLDGIDAHNQQEATGGCI